MVQRQLGILPISTIISKTGARIPTFHRKARLEKTKVLNRSEACRGRGRGWGGSDLPRATQQLRKWARGTRASAGSARNHLSRNERKTWTAHKASATCSLFSLCYLEQKPKFRKRPSGLRSQPNQESTKVAEQNPPICSALVTKGLDFLAFRSQLRGHTAREWFKPTTLSPRVWETWFQSQHSPLPPALRAPLWASVLSFRRCS